MRYTEARLSLMAEEMLQDIDKNTIDFGDNFDGTLKEPFVLPSRLPNMLLNGSSGIAVGMATNIPPHNLRELVKAINYLIEHYDSIDKVTPDALMEFLPGPTSLPAASLLAMKASARPIPPAEAGLFCAVWLTLKKFAAAVLPSLLPKFPTRSTKPV